MTGVFKVAYIRYPHILCIFCVCTDTDSHYLRMNIYNAAVEILRGINKTSRVVTGFTLFSIVIYGSRILAKQNKKPKYLLI